MVPQVHRRGEQHCRAGASFLTNLNSQRHPETQETLSSILVHMCAKSSPLLLAGSEGGDFIASPREEKLSQRHDFVFNFFIFNLANYKRNTRLGKVALTFNPSIEKGES